MSFPAVPVSEDVPALSHEEYLPSTSHTGELAASGAGRRSRGCRGGRVVR